MDLKPVDLKKKFLTILFDTEVKLFNYILIINKYNFSSAKSHVSKISTMQLQFFVL